ncbi:hypothetical protein CDD81_5240 [Ophiocordyceps australis]|uniref:FAD-binding PCMH-type domain-containing protein n=1 Tax=Ophiocordyceps australis TaxID=1399860 RepID=A0A2C5XMA7_9HYPO|nr:hypothetical protein CDD81_5240 [Ophiocordyceps australis]
MRFLVSVGWVVASLLARGVKGGIDDDVEFVCDSLASKYPEHVIWDPVGPRGAETVMDASIYNRVLVDYWNAASAGNRPVCTFVPESAEQVSRAIKLLKEHGFARFALKGGGHNPNLGFSSVDKGVLISFRPNMMQAVPSSDGTTIEVGPGCKWEQLYEVLDPFGKSVVGGRLGDVGIMGFILGGGLSYLSAQHGFACDNVMEFECVTAEGEILTATRRENSDLFWALRGGGNQYAVVTRMKLKTHDVGDNGMVWGGVRTYASVHHERLLSAIAKFTSGDSDPKAAIIPTFNFASGLGLTAPPAIIVFFQYDASRPTSDVFADFDAIPSITDDTRTQTTSSLTREVLGGNYKGLRFQIRENTFPSMAREPMEEFLNGHYKRVASIAAAGAVRDPADFRLMSFAIQPMPRTIANASIMTGGGNALGLHPEHGDRIWIEYDLAWLNPSCDKRCPRFFRYEVSKLPAYHRRHFANIPPTNYMSGSLEYVSYNPIFMNDAMYDQDPLVSYGRENYRRLRAIKIKYDNADFFGRQQLGFRFSTAP